MRWCTCRHEVQSRGVQASPPATEQAKDIRDLYNILLVAATVVFVLVEGAIVFAVFRYRRRDDQPVGRRGDPWRLRQDRHDRGPGRILAQHRARQRLGDQAGYQRHR